MFYLTETLAEPATDAIRYIFVESGAALCHTFVFVVGVQITIVGVYPKPCNISV